MSAITPEVSDLPRPVNADPMACDQAASWSVRDAHVCCIEVVARAARWSARYLRQRRRVGQTEAVTLRTRTGGGGGAGPARAASPAVLSRAEGAAADAGARTGAQGQGQFQGMRCLPRNSGGAERLV